jgi:hypothetical protein
MVPYGKAGHPPGLAPASSHVSSSDPAALAAVSGVGMMSLTGTPPQLGSA